MIGCLPKHLGCTSLQCRHCPDGVVPELGPMQKSFVHSSFVDGMQIQRCVHLEATYRSNILVVVLYGCDIPSR